jgi:hypothetical protein
VNDKKKAHISSRSPRPGITVMEKKWVSRVVDYIPLPR